MSKDAETIRLAYEDEGMSDPKSNNLVSITFPGGVEQSFERDKADRITRITAKKLGGPTHLDLKWDYTPTGPDGQKLTDASGQQVETALRQELTDVKRDVTTTYRYDYLNRLVGAEEDPGDKWSYAYNNASELLWSERNGNRTRYNHNKAHEITSRDGGPSWGYDDQGNLIDVPGELSLAYNDRNQTRQITPQGGSSIDLTYAGEGQSDRLRLGDTSYVSDALGLAAQRTGGQSTHFTRTDGGTPLGLRKGGESYYYLTDSIGSVMGMVDGSGNLAGSYSYDPYGKIRPAATSEQVQNPIRFAGYLYDHPSGLYRPASATTIPPRRPGRRRTPSTRWRIRGRLTRMSMRGRIR